MGLNDFFEFDDDTIKEVNRGLSSYTARTSWTDIKEVILGNGETPPSVVVPVDQRIAPGAMYVTEQQIDNKAVYQVINVNGGIPFDNTVAGTPVLIGYPEGSDVLQIKSASERTPAFTGGAPPSEIRVSQQQMVTPDRTQELKIIPTNPVSLSVILTGGKWRVGNTIKTWLQDTAIDLTSNVPGTSAKAVYTLVSIAEDALTVTATNSAEFDTTTSTHPSLLMQTAIPVNDLALAWVYLANGQTTVIKANILPIQHLPTVPKTNIGNVTATATASPPTLSVTDHIVTADATGGAYTITLPTAVGNAGLEYIIKKIDATATVTVDGAGSETIDGATTKSMTTQWDKMQIRSDGANWIITGGNI